MATGGRERELGEQTEAKSEGFQSHHQKDRISALNAGHFYLILGQSE